MSLEGSTFFNPEDSANKSFAAENPEAAQEVDKQFEKEPLGIIGSEQNNNDKSMLDTDTDNSEKKFDIENKYTLKDFEKLEPEELDELVDSKVDVHDIAKKLEVSYNERPSSDPENAELQKRESVIRSLAYLIIKMNKKLDNYDTLISDDSSGRLVTLFMREIVNKRRAELGKEPIETRFVAGGKHGKDSIHSAVTNLLRERPPSGKTLLVTEYIDTGRSIIKLMNDFEKADVDFDLATVSIKNKPRKYSRKIRKHLFFGSVGEDGMAFHGKIVTGVRKDPSSDSPFPIKSDSSHFFDKKQGRNDVKTLADELYPIIQELNN